MNASLPAPPLNNTGNFSLPLCNGTESGASSATLSGGSAAFILVALMLGTLSQPSGSLVVSSSLGSWRIWRLSPLLCGLEGLTILVALLVAPFFKVSQRERAFTILATRTTSTHDERRALVTYLERPKLELIVPMMLQVIKLMFIRGSTLTTTLAVLYWVDWATVQYCQCWVWFAPFTDNEARCPHSSWELQEKGPVCKVDWGGIAGLSDTIAPFTTISKIIGVVLLLASNMFITGWWTWRLILVLYWIQYESHWAWYKQLPTFIALAIVAKLLFWGPGVMGSIMLLGRGNSRKEVTNFALLRFWVVMITFVGLGIYYRFLYDDAKTYKPSWLDWLG